MLEAERAAHLTHMEGARQTAAAEKAALAKRYQVCRFSCGCRPSKCVLSLGRGKGLRPQAQGVQMASA